MTNLFQLSEEEKNRIRGLHLTESKDKRFTSVLNEQIPHDVLDALNALDDPYGGESEGIVNPDPIIRTIDAEGCLTVTFECGESTIKDEEVESIDFTKYLGKGMTDYDRKFINITAGVSGPGNADDNQRVMNARIDAALDLLVREMEGIRGPNGLPYSVESLKNNADIEMDYGTTEAGSVLQGERVPDDPCDPWFEQFQYVKICFEEVGDTPGYGSLANQFMAVTMEKTGTHEGTVYDILDQLRDGDDFYEFNEELKRDHGMDFYEVACDVFSIDLNPLWPGETEGPPELGGGDTTINAHLRRLGVEPISC
tara:strand:+ start:637 stop:1569 length:933 start_codon:yes stop_codon:yes gene_type:complete